MQTIGAGQYLIGSLTSEEVLQRRLQVRCQFAVSKGQLVVSIESREGLIVCSHATPGLTHIVDIGHELAHSPSLLKEGFGRSRCHLTHLFHQEVDVHASHVSHVWVTLHIRSIHAKVLQLRGKAGGLVVDEVDVEQHVAGLVSILVLNLTQANVCHIALAGRGGVEVAVHARHLQNGQLSRGADARVQAVSAGQLFVGGFASKEVLQCRLQGRSQLTADNGQLVISIESREGLIVCSHAPPGLIHIVNIGHELLHFPDTLVGCTGLGGIVSLDVVKL